MKWMKQDLKSREQHLYDLLSRVRLSLLPREYLESTVHNETLLQNSSHCLSLCTEAIQCYDNPVKRLCLNILPRKSKKNDFGLIYVLGKRFIEWFDMVSDRWYSCRFFEKYHVCLASVPFNKKIYMIRYYSRTLEIYDPLTNSFECKAYANKRPNRFSNTACVLGDCIYFLGGTGGSNFVERYNISNNKWEIVTRMSIGRSLCAAVTLNGFIYALGGESYDNSDKSVSFYSK